MATATVADARSARRQRILEGSQDRLALITGHVQDSPSASSQSNNPAASIATAQSPPLVSHDRDPIAALSCPPTGLRTQCHFTCVWKGADKQDAEPCQYHGSGSAQLLATLLNPFGSTTLQQLSFALAATARARMASSITMALLVLMSYFGFPVFGNKIVRSIILFCPLLFLLFSNVAFIVLRLLPELKRGEKDGNKLTASNGYAWAEETGRALEVGLMLYNSLETLFMDSVLYVLIITCGTCLSS